MKGKIGLIVDGAGDYHCFRKKWSDAVKVVKTDGPRGDCASPAQLARGSRKQVEMLRACGCTLVIVVADFESRSCEWSDFVAQLRRETLRANGGSGVDVAAPNQMVENWLLADIMHISAKSSFLKPVKTQKVYEGKPGKEWLKRYMNRGVSYRETRHGPAMFAVMRLDEARQRSRSLDAFLEVMQQ